jgi:hypothetical protein
MNKALLLPALSVLFFSNGSWGDPPPRLSLVTLEDERAINAKIESILRDESLPKFGWHYTLDAAMRACIQLHRSAEKEFTDPSFQSLGMGVGRPKLVVTTFEEGKSWLIERCLVSPAGRKCSWLEVYNHATWQMERETLTIQRLLTLDEILADLPEENEYPALAELAIVSFNQDGRWVTRTFYTVTVQNLLSLLRPVHPGYDLGIVPPPLAGCPQIMANFLHPRLDLSHKPN